MSKRNRDKKKAQRKAKGKPRGAAKARKLNKKTKPIGYRKPQFAIADEHRFDVDEPGEMTQPSTGDEPWTKDEPES